MEVTARTLTVNGLRIRYLSAGEQDASPDRSTVVLLHGGGIDSANLSWELLIPALAPHFRVLAPDFPGYGESEQAPAGVARSTYSVSGYVAFLRDFLDALNVRRASLVGISMGGSVALGFTLNAAERVEKLVLVDSYGLQRRAPFHRLSWLFVHLPGVNAATRWAMRSRSMVRYSLGSLLARPDALTPTLLDQVYRDANRTGALEAWNAFQRDEMTWQGTRTCFLDQLGEIQVPTLILQGEKDTLVPAECAREAQRRIPNARLHWMKDCGHWPQRDDPAAFNQVVRDFLLE